MVLKELNQNLGDFNEQFLWDAILGFNIFHVVWWS